MFDARAFETRIDELIMNDRLEEAERELLTALAEFEVQGDTQYLGLVHSKLAFFYAIPIASEDPVKAEAHFLKWESLSPEPYTLLQTATFYFYVLRDFSRTIAKVDEIKERFEVARNASYYSALPLKGESLVNLNRVDDAGEVLKEMLAMLEAVGPSSRGRPCGDELNFLSAAISKPALAERCRELVELIIPRIISPEYVQRANSLLERIQRPRK